MYPLFHFTHFTNPLKENSIDTNSSIVLQSIKTRIGDIEKWFFCKNLKRIQKEKGFETAKDFIKRGLKEKMKYTSYGKP